MENTYLTLKQCCMHKITQMVMCERGLDNY